jgi:oligopeptide transport system permease protein
MLSFVISRLLQGIAVILAVIVITFALMKGAKGSPYDTERAIPEHVRKIREAQLGLSQPWYVQLSKHIWNFATFNPPDSQKYDGMGVGEIIRSAAPLSLAIGLPALLIALAIGVPAGALAALRPNTLEDRTAMIAATLGICSPSLVLGPLLALVFGLKLHWFNVAGWYDTSDWVLPALTLGIIYAAYISRITRAGLRETLAQDFIRTARAKGASEASIVARHAFKLACLPLLNYLGPAAAALLSGSFVTENVFQIPGLGQHFVSAAVNRDLTLTMATAALYAAMIVGFNFIVDVVQALLNPRIGFKG